MEKGSRLIMHLAESLLEALDAGDRKRLLARSREAVSSLSKPARSTLETELAELLSGIAGELVSVLEAEQVLEAGQILEAEQAEDSSTNQLSLYRDLLSHVKAMAQQKL